MERISELKSFLRQEIRKAKIESLRQVTEKLADLEKELYGYYQKSPRLFKKKLDESNGVVIARNTIIDLISNLKNNDTKS